MPLNQVRTSGTIEPRTQGDDRRSKRIEAHLRVILGLVAEAPDITLVGLADTGYGFGIGTLWRFFDRHRITRKKDRPRGGTEPRRYPEAAQGLVRRAYERFGEQLGLSMKKRHGDP
jgi:hypothetical protein